MIIDFKNMQEKPVEGFRGGIGITNLKKFENELGKIILGRLEPGATIGLHTHETNSEAIYIVSGTADFIYDPGASSGTSSAADQNHVGTASAADQNHVGTSSAADQNHVGTSSAAECAAKTASSPNTDLNPTAMQISETVSAGGCHYCPKGHSHSMINNSEEDVIFFAVIPEQ